MMTDNLLMLKADARAIPLGDDIVQCIITSPPYWGLRDYGLSPLLWDDPPWRGSLGLEPIMNLYISHLVQIFREARRVLKPDGTIWLNLGDSYSSGCKDSHGNRCGYKQQSNRGTMLATGKRLPMPPGLKPKDLHMMPFRVAMALQADGWYLRSVIPWIKRNTMPESCKDRPTTAVEYLFLLSRSERYFYDYSAIQIPASPDTHARYGRGRSADHKYADGGPGGQTLVTTTLLHEKMPSGWKSGPGGHRDLSGRFKHPGVNPKALCGGKEPARLAQGLRTGSRFGREPGWRSRQNASFSASVKDLVAYRNCRTSDWFMKSFEGLLCDEGGGH